MTQHKIVENLTFDLITKLNLKASQDLLVSEVNALLTKYPQLFKFIGKNKEALTKADLDAAMSLILTDKKINNKTFNTVFRKKQAKKLSTILQDEQNKMMLYDFLLISFYIFISLLITMMKLNKLKRTLEEFQVDEKKSKVELFNNRKLKASGKSKFRNNIP